MGQPRLYCNTALASALHDMFDKLSDELELNAASKPMTAYIAGGMAVHLYTGTRVTTDVDMELNVLAIIPPNISVTTTLEDGTFAALSFDRNFFMAITLMHEDYQENAIDLPIGALGIRLKVLSPIDLAISKLARFADNDKSDIALLAHAGLLPREEFKQKAEHALVAYVGQTRFVEMNLHDALEIIDEYGISEP